MISLQEEKPNLRYKKILLINFIILKIKFLLGIPFK